MGNHNGNGSGNNGDNNSDGNNSGNPKTKTIIIKWGRYIVSNSIRL